MSADLNLDPNLSWIIHEHHERHYYVDLPGQKPHKVNGLSCSCAPSIEQKPDKVWVVVHRAFGGGETLDGLGANG